MRGQVDSLYRFRQPALLEPVVRTLLFMVMHHDDHDEDLDPRILHPGALLDKVHPDTRDTRRLDKTEGRRG